MATISALLPLALQLLGWLLSRSQASKESKERFFEWIKLVSKDLGSVKLMEYGDKGLEYLKNNPWKETK